MKTHNIPFYRLANEGIGAQTLQRIRYDRAITTDKLRKICHILRGKVVLLYVRLHYLVQYHIACCLAFDQGEYQTLSVIIPLPP